MVDLCSFSKYSANNTDVWENIMVLQPFDYLPDYQKMLEYVSKQREVSLDSLLSYFENKQYAVTVENPMHKLLYGAFLLNLHVFQQIPEDLHLDSSMIFLFQVVLYDYYDFLLASIHFRGIQIFSVARSLIEHARVFLLACLDETFLNAYKNDPQYVPKPSGISKKLQEIAKKAQQKQSIAGKNYFDPEIIIANLDPNLFQDFSEDGRGLYKQLSEITHLSKMSMTQKIFGKTSEFVPCIPKQLTYNKYLDMILEYVISTALVITLIFYAKDVPLSQEIVQMYNFLHSIREELDLRRAIRDNVDSYEQEIRANEGFLMEEATKFWKQFGIV